MKMKINKRVRVFTIDKQQWNLAGVFMRNFGWLGVVAASIGSSGYSAYVGLHHRGVWNKVLLFAGLLTLVSYAVPSLWKFFTQDKEA